MLKNKIKESNKNKEKEAASKSGKFKALERVNVEEGEIEA